MDLGVTGTGYLLVGGTSGMGLATARAMAADGADLVLVGRDATRAKQAAARIGTDSGTRVHAVAADVRQPGDMERVVAEAVDLLDDLGGLAVFTGTSGHRALDASDAEWTEAFDDVLLGTTRAVRAILPRLVERGGGTIVTLAAYGIAAPAADRLPYQTLKAGVAVLTKAVAKTYGRHGIRANCVCPGAIETDGLHRLRGILAEERGIPYAEALERVMAEDWNMKVALGRPGQPEEVGELVAFLLSPRAGYLTGALINIDGGTDF
ncbi:SDR family NAD(P)-dependent oxidoreductase [Frankia gtarii]|uniref:SDR family NAD(P)-dependent oxidoreductase n=1 Tax=Frankia gtarii TaxID=2950102 RepID=UPI0021C23B96|nr:SDR family oxidoreductase [Frankia gtarii]